MKIRDILQSKGSRVECVAPKTMALMTERRVRHLPIMDGDQLAGVVSIGDVVNALRETSEVEARYLRDYIRG